MAKKALIPGAGSPNAVRIYSGGCFGTRPVQIRPTRRVRQMNRLRPFCPCVSTYALYDVRTTAFSPVTSIYALVTSGGDTAAPSSAMLVTSPMQRRERPVDQPGPHTVMLFPVSVPDHFTLLRRKGTIRRDRDAAATVDGFVFVYQPVDTNPGVAGSSGDNRAERSLLQNGLKYISLRFRCFWYSINNLAIFSKCDMYRPR